MKNKSFTLIELLVIIAIIGLLASIILVGLRGAKERAEIGQVYTDFDGFRKLILLYYQDHDGKLPPNGAGSHCGWEGSRWPPGANCECFRDRLANPLSPYTETELNLRDPWGNCYIWHYHPGSTECNFIMSLGPNGAGDWWAEHGCRCDDDDICIFYGRGTQTYHPGEPAW